MRLYWSAVQASSSNCYSSERGHWPLHHSIAIPYTTVSKEPNQRFSHVCLETATKCPAYPRALMTAKDRDADDLLRSKFRHTSDSRSHFVESRSAALSLSSGANFNIEVRNSTKSLFSSPTRPGLSTKPSSEHDGKGDSDNKFPTPY